MSAYSDWKCGALSDDEYRDLARREEREDDPCCGRCQYHRRDGSLWYCYNENSEYYGCETGYEDGCNEVEERA